MTIENLKKHHARLKWLVSGEFTERDFDYTIKANDNPHGKEKGEGGWSTMGEFVNKAGEKRKELIILKGKKALERFEDNYDENYNPKKKKQVREEEKPSQPPITKETKSKEKK